MIKKIIGVLLLIFIIATIASFAGEPPNSVHEFMKDFFACLIVMGVTGGFAGLIALAICLIFGDI